MHPLLLRVKDPNDPAEKIASEEKRGILGTVKEDNPKENAGGMTDLEDGKEETCLLYTSPSPRDATLSRMPSSA